MRESRTSRSVRGAGVTRFPTAIASAHSRRRFAVRKLPGDRRQSHLSSKAARRADRFPFGNDDRANLHRRDL